MPLTASRMIQALERLGFVRARIRGSHIIYKHADGRRAVVPYHAGRVIAQPLLGRNLREAKLTLADIERALR